MPDTTSFLDQWRNAQTKAGKQNALIGGGLSALNGGLQLATGAITSARVNDMPQYDWQINQINQAGQGNYYSFDQLAQGYNTIDSIMPDIDFDDIRGMNTGQKIGSVGNLALSGATTGATIGGPWGALVGGVAGLGAGIVGVFAGDAEAERKKRIYENEAMLAQANARTNLNAAHERLTDYQFRSGVAHAVAEGGRIERKKQSLQEFAARALRKPQAREMEPFSGITHSKCKGGTMVRIKR